MIFVVQCESNDFLDPSMFGCVLMNFEVLIQLVWILNSHGLISNARVNSMRGVYGFSSSSFISLFHC